jgi:hypothetical protein
MFLQQGAEQGTQIDMSFFILIVYLVQRPDDRLVN